MRTLIFSALLLYFCCLSFQKIYSQVRIDNDSVSVRVLDSIVVTSSLRLNSTPYLRDIEGVSVFAGKKTNSLILDHAKANLAGATTRMIFSQVPGLTLWDMSGTGGQVNIGSRGTDAHRGIEMNVRQNGYTVNSDVFGYPEVHYTVAMEGVQKIELLRGSSALQFGPQFGGMINYVMKEPDSSKPITVESQQTGGSFGFFNSFNAIGGVKGKWRYYTFYNNRHGDGWRNNSAFVYHSYYGNVQFQFSDKGNLSLQFSRMDYREQIAGGLTDEQFNENSRASTRTRNFFAPAINIPALIFSYKFSDKTKLQIISHYLNGERNSVQFLNPPNIPDTVNKAIGSFNARQVDRDYYNGFTTEGRLLRNYSIGTMKGALAAGVRFFDQVTKRRQKGNGTTGNDYDLGLIKPYGIDLRLHSINYAAFIENIFNITERLSITPGLRYENIKTRMTGVINNATAPVSYSSARSFPLFGAGIEYAATKETRFYGNMSQAYRPFLYASITPADRIDIVDPNLKDSKGYDIDLGYRGSVGNVLKFDVNGYYLFYGNRVGQLTQTNEAGANYLFTTNIGDAVSKGLEAYVSISFGRLLLPTYFSTAVYKLRLFNSLSYTHATYGTAKQSIGGRNFDLKGKWIENTPRWTNRTGLTWQHKMFIAQLTFTYVGKSFSDANNTFYSSNGVTGIIPAYKVWDVSTNWRFSGTFSVSAGINNFTNSKYFSRRISMYPGPGILPADGRSWYVGLGIKI